MNRIVRQIVLSGAVLGCTISISAQTIQPAFALPNKTIASSVKENVNQNINFERHFRELGVEGAILIYDAKNNHFYQHNPQRNRTPFLPASTFKILNSLISLETGVISDETAVLKWDGIQRQVPEWNRDLNMREAFKYSAVWFYQVLARRVGYERMQKMVMQSGYGNQKIGSKEDIDKFWLTGDLRITPQEQIQFLRRLYMA